MAEVKNTFKITIVAGARPNFIKIAPIIKEINIKKNEGLNIDYRFVHTGQHYDDNMSRLFLEELNIPKPHVNFNCGGGTQSEITSKIMKKFEKELTENKTSLVLVVGDVTSTMACAIVAQKMNVDVAHIEAGIRSSDWKMPEEINRLVTDSISNFFFTTTISANNNLLKEGKKNENIFFVGNTMIDTLIEKKAINKKPIVWDKLNLNKKKYIIITLHRPRNVDNKENLKKILEKIIKFKEDFQFIFPIHPRTKKTFEKINVHYKNLHILPPLSYLEFNYLLKNSFAIITDSGGITEEATFLNIPCMTIRDNTERPETVELGTNELIGTNPKEIPKALNKLFLGNWKKGSVPKFWDGKTSKRIIKHLIKLYL